MKRLALIALTVACLLAIPATSQAQYFRIRFHRAGCGPGMILLQQTQPAIAQPVAVAAAAQPTLDPATIALLGRIDGQQGAILQRLQDLGRDRGPLQLDPAALIALNNVVGAQDRILGALERGNGDHAILNELARQQIGAQDRLINAIREMPRPTTLPAATCPGCSGGGSGGLLIQQSPGGGGTTVQPLPSGGTTPMQPLPPTTPPTTPPAAFRQATYSTHHETPK